jgi:hypothetical protein
MTADSYSLANIQAWKRRFSQAADEGELLAAAREFLATLTEGEREIIQAPPATVPFRNADEVLEYALHLTQLEMSLDWDDVLVGKTVRTVASLFIEASRRITALSEARVLRRFEDTRVQGPAVE